MDWIDIIENDYDTYPSEGFYVIVSDGEKNAQAYFLCSGEYEWRYFDEELDEGGKFKSFIPTKWYMIPQELVLGDQLVCINSDSKANRCEQYYLHSYSNIDYHPTTRHPTVIVSNHKDLSKPGTTAWVSKMANFVTLAESRSQIIETIINE